MSSSSSHTTHGTQGIFVVDQREDNECKEHDPSQIASEMLEAMEDQLEADRVADLVLHMQRQRELERRLRQQIQSLDRRLRESQKILRELFTQFNAVVSFLIEKGLIKSEKFDSYAKELIKEYGLNRRYQAGLGILLNQPDRKKSMFETDGNVDCEDRIDLCHGRCCQLGFALSAEEVESGELEWEPDWPFYIKRDKDGFCVHWDRQTGLCQIYDRRPEICRTYSCEKDKRMWENFEEKTPGPYAKGTMGAGNRIEEKQADRLLNEEGE